MAVKPSPRYTKQYRKFTLGNSLFVFVVMGYWIWFCVKAYAINKDLLIFWFIGICLGQMAQGLFGSVTKDVTAEEYEQVKNK